MKTLKIILIVLGVGFALLLLTLLALGVKIAGTVFVWILGILLFLMLIGWIGYLVGKSRSGSEG